MSDDQAKANIATNIRRLLALREPPENQQKWLADQSGESDMRISLYARGEKMASAGVLSRIADALEVTIDDLVNPPPKSGRSGQKKSA